MSVGQLSINVDSGMAQNAIKALENRVRGLENALADTNSTSSDTGGKWTELASKMTVLGSVASTALQVFNKFQQSAKERGVLFSQFGENADIGAAKLMKYSAAVDYMINANALMRSSNALVNGDLKVSEDRFESVTKAAVQFARASGEDVNTILKTLTDSINAGTTRGLKQFGIQIDDTGTKAQKSERILFELHKRFKDIKIAAGDAAEDMDKFKNKTKIMELVGGDAIERLTRKYQSMKLSAAEAVAFVFDSSTAQLYDQKISQMGEKVFANTLAITDEISKQVDLRIKAADLSKNDADNGQRRREIADEMVISLDKQIALLKSSLERQKMITDYAQRTGENYERSKEKLEQLKLQLSDAVKKQAEWTAEAARTGGIFGKIYDLSIDYIKKGAAITGKTIENIEKEVKRRKDAADAYKKLSDEEKLNLKLKQIELGKNIELTQKELFLLNKMDSKNNAYVEQKKAAELYAKLTKSHLQAESDWMQKMTPQYELQGKYLNEKNRLERLYQEEVSKGNNADIFKLQAISDKMLNLKNQTELLKGLNQKINENRNVDYTNLIMNENKILELRQLEERRDLAIKQGKYEIAVAIQKNIDVIYKEAEANATSNLQYKQKLETLNSFKVIYGSLADSQQLSLDLQKQEIELAKAKQGTDQAKIISITETINKIKEQQEALGQFNLKMKEWEQSSYGALGAVKNIWQASGDAILMTDAQLRKAGKTRAQVIKQAVQAQILALGKQNLFEGGTNLAKGFAATAMGNPAAAGFFKAAGIHFAVAAAAGIGNSLFGGGGGGKQEDKAKTAPTTNVNTTNQQSSTTIIQFQNSMLFGSVDELARGVDSVLKDAGRRGQI